MAKEHHVLLIEDNDVDAAVFARYVHAMPGWHVIRVRSLEEAEERVEELGTGYFDLVAVDLTLPDAVDLEAVQFARQQIPQAVCVAVTARDPEEVDERALRAGAADLLVKGQMNARGVQRAVSHAVERNELVRRQLESERNLRSVLSAWSDALLVIDDERRILFRNEAAAVLAESLVEDGRLRLGIEPTDVLQTDIARDGTEPLPVEIRSWRLTWADQPALAVVLRDRRAERAAERARHLAEAGKGALEGVHDIGNRVQAMHGILGELLHDHQPEPPVADALRRLERHVDHIAHVVRASRVGASQLRRRRIPVDLGALVRSSCHEMRSAIEAVADLRLQIEPAAEVRGEPFELTRVVDNLLKNAVEAIAEGRVEDRHEIRVSVREDADQVVLEVEDTGPGIPAPMVARVFHDGVTGKRTGTGLGLANARRILEEHEGAIELVTGSGRGACFRVTLPAVRARASRVRVLLLEDQPEVARANERLLRAHFTVEVATDGAAGLERLQRDAAFDVVLCDLDMPGVDGRGFFECLTTRHPHLVERVVFCSGGATTPELEAFVQGSGRPLLQKPLHLAEALAVVDAVAERAALPA